MREPDAPLLMTGRDGGRQDLERELIDLAGELLGFLTHHVGDAETAADLAQETLAKALASLHRLRRRDALRGWLFRIAVNSFNDHLRRPRLPRAELSPELEPPVMPCRQPDREALARELDTVLRAELQRLPERQRTVLMLHGIEGTGQQDVADLLGISRAAVKVSLFHARERMRRRLARYLGRRRAGKDGLP